LKPAADALTKEKKFFIWIRCNPLKSPDSAKGIQGNPSLFIWISLVSLGEIRSKSGKIGAYWVRRAARRGSA
jgi:hypothetical protein